VTSRARLGVVLALGAAACHPAPAPSGRPRSSAGGTHVGEVASNILRADYAGSAVCARCHAQIYRRWMASPMHNMTRPADRAAIRARFAGAFRFKDDVARFDQSGTERHVTLERPGAAPRRFLVTKVIGGHHREDFVGVEEGARGPERILPVSYSFSSESWRYKGYSVMTPERPELRPGAVWSRTCIFCHNTAPYFSTIFGALAGAVGGPSPGPYQGEVVDPLLPADRRWQLRVTDELALERAAKDELVRMGDERAVTGAAPVVAEAVKATRARFAERDLVEVGIGCESCHGGSREHVEHVGLAPSLLPKSAFLKLEGPRGAPDEVRAQAVNRVCARCHQVLFTRYPYTWEGGRRAEAPGGSHINSGEARDLLLGGCAGALSCVACHDPHAPAEEVRPALESLEGSTGDAVCLRCHGRYAGDEALRAHTHHDPSGAGARCMACHMPKKNMSLDNRLTRYHRIGSPTDRARVEGDRPIECALCHADRTVESLVSTMEGWWQKRYDREALVRLYGATEVNPLQATLEHGRPHEQATAIATLGAYRIRASAPAIAALLTHGVPIVRYYAEAALAQILARPPGIDLFQADSAIEAQAAAYLRGFGLAPVRPQRGNATTSAGGTDED
jgi:hypothetical protein